MNTVTLFSSAKLPAFAKNTAMSAAAKALAGSGGGGYGKRISVKGGVFRLIADGKEIAAIEERYLDVVIVNTAPKVSRTFYASLYDENKSVPPDCWSQDGDKPDPASKDMQASSCAQCPQNVKGSGQGDSRACRYLQRLAVVLANDIEGDVMQLSLAATSVFGKADGENRPLQEHARYLIAQGVDPTMLVTRLKFDTKAPVPKLFFKPMRWLTDDEFATCQEQGTSAEALKAITMTVSQQDGVVAAPMITKVLPKPVVEDDDDEPPAPAPKAKAKAKPAALPPEDDDEPQVRAAAPNPKKNVPAATGVAKTLADWDD